MWFAIVLTVVASTGNNVGKALQVLCCAAHRERQRIPNVFGKAGLLQ